MSAVSWLAVECVMDLANWPADSISRVADEFTVRRRGCCRFVTGLDLDPRLVSADGFPNEP
jgi:hypothetical protein